MRGIVRSLIVSLWFMILTFPIMAIKVVPTDTGSFILWRWKNVFYLGISIFFLSFVWRGFMVRKGMMTPEEADLVWLFNFFRDSQHKKNAFAIIFIVAGMLPLIFSLIDGQGLQSFSSLPVTILFITGLFLGILTLKGKQQVLLHLFSRINNQVNDSDTTKNTIFLVIVCIMVALGILLNSYQLSVLSSTLIWVMLGLGLNIIVGQAGMLVLGYVAFYAVGAYTYAVGNTYFGGPLVGFWIFLPFGGLLAAFAGILLSLPILRLRGDYLAIVTLGFGEIVRVFLEAGSFSLAPIANFLTSITGWEMPGWMSFPISVGGPAGFSGIPVPGLLGMSLTLEQGAQLLYFVALIMTFITIFAVTRLRDSRLGRSWMALREDEIACEAMGINKVTTKLSAFALGACWAGFGGVLFAAQTSFINPSSFTFMESAIILSIVVLGGLGSILGVILGACILLILPEYLRSFNEYRMLIFGASMVLMMVFRPQGLITPARKKPVFGAISRATGNGGKV